MFPRLLQFPFAFRLDFRRPSRHHVTGRDIANGTVQPHIVVVVDQPVYHPLRVFEARQFLSAQQFVLQRVVVYWSRLTKDTKLSGHLEESTMSKPRKKRTPQEKFKIVMEGLRGNYGSIAAVL